MNNYYIDDQALAELNILRGLAALHQKIKMVDRKGFSQDSADVRAGLYRQIERLLKRYEEVINQYNERYDEAVGIVIGRFQLHKLHDPHKCLIDMVRQRHPCYGLALGTTEKGVVDQKNPLPYHMRASMILEDYSDAVTFPIEDVLDSDEKWSQNLDQAIRVAFPKGKVRLYGGRDSFIPHYKGQFLTTEITAIDGTSGTEVRKQVGETPESSQTFRRGVIFATQIQLQEVQLKGGSDERTESDSAER